VGGREKARSDKGIEQRRQVELDQGEAAEQSSAKEKQLKAI
jgi:hypothetical protein